MQRDHGGNGGAGAFTACLYASRMPRAHPVAWILKGTSRAYTICPYTCTTSWGGVIKETSLRYICCSLVPRHSTYSKTKLIPSQALHCPLWLFEAIRSKKPFPIVCRYAFVWLITAFWNIAFSTAVQYAAVTYMVLGTRQGLLYSIYKYTTDNHCLWLYGSSS